jgi:uncharacterized membrane protein
MKLEATTRLKAKRTVHAGAEDIKENGTRITRGANTYKCKSPGDAYLKASQFIANLDKAGFKFLPHGTSTTMDTFKKGGTEISVGVHATLLKIDLW